MGIRSPGTVIISDERLDEYFAENPPPAGQNGVTPTFSVFAVNTLAPGSAAMVQLDGTATAKTFTFGIPVGYNGTPGATGATGPKGDKGDTGNTGPQGPAGAKGDTGATGAQGPIGNTGAQGPQGNVGATGPQGVKGDTGATGAQGPVGNTGPQGATGATGPQGPAGSNATATPLATAVPLANTANGSVGTSANAAREDHRHPGANLTLLGAATVGESALVTLGLSVRRYTVTTITVAAGSRIIAVNNGVPQNGSLQDVYVAAANNINVGALIPVLGVAATVSIPLAFYLIN